MKNSLEVTAEPLLPAITRPNVRRLAEHNMKALLRAGESGQNVHQLALDQQDQIQNFMLSLPADDATQFGLLYSEEMDAVAAVTQDNARQLNAETAAIHQRTAEQQIQTAKQSYNVAVWMFLIAFFAALFFFIRYMKS